jgi:hypothetical protein
MKMTKAPYEPTPDAELPRKTLAPVSAEPEKRKRGRPPKNSEPEPSNPEGRPSKYRPEYAEQAKTLCEYGATDIEIAKFFKVSGRTIYRWQIEFPEFCQALKIGKSVSDDRVERSLYHRATATLSKAKKSSSFRVKLSGQIPSSTCRLM